MRRTLWMLGGLAVAAALVIGLLQTRGDDPDTRPQANFDLDAALQRLDGSPPPLARLHERANQIEGGTLDATLAQLEGHPVVVNAWAAWCGPCKLEFPIFQRVSTQLGKEVAFVGLNVLDERERADAYLATTPVPYPSIEDGSGRMLRGAGGANLPTTFFYDRQGRVQIHQGGFTSDADLREAIRRYTGA